MAIAPGPGLCADRFLNPNSSSGQGTQQDCIEIEGKVITVLPGTMFRVQLDNGHMVLAHLSGKMRKHFIRIGAGDRVKMEMSPYDTEKARITFRVRDPNAAPYVPRRRR